MKRRTQDGYHDRIGRVVAAILADPAADHSVETLASVAALSPFHFHRIYRAMTGEGVAETVRRVRLARAAKLLGETEEPVIAIALDAGYESAPAFARAFRQFSGTNPSAFKASRKTLAGCSADNTLPPIELQKVAPMRLLVLRHDGPLESISHTHRRLATVLASHFPRETLSHRIGISEGDPEGGDSFTYRVGVAVGKDVGPIGGLELLDLPGGLYASYRHIGAYGLITSAYHILFGGWLPRSGHELDGRPALEIYRSPWSHGDRQDCVTDLMIPIKEP